LDILLIRHPDELAKFSEMIESLALSYLASYLRQHEYTVEILDPCLSGWDEAVLIDQVIKRDFKLLGMSVNSPSILRKTKDLLNKLRLSGMNAPIVLGGFLPSFEDILTLENITDVDFVVRFEGEQTLVELIKNIDFPEKYSSVTGLTYRYKNQIFQNPLRPLIKELDSIHFPSRDHAHLLADSPGYLNILSSRGCFRNCTFCTAQQYTTLPGGPKWRGRSPSNIIDEIEMIIAKWGIRNFVFVDDTFFGPGLLGKERVREFSAEILRRNIKCKFKFECHVKDIEPEIFSLLKSAGLVRVFLGLESGVQQMLDRFNKMSTVEQNKKSLHILSELGIGVDIGFIMFDPYTTFEEVKQNLGFLKSIDTYRGPLMFQDMIIAKGSEMESALTNQRKLVPREYIHDYIIDDDRVEWIRRTMTKCRLELAFIGKQIQQRLLKQAFNSNYCDQELIRSFDWDLINLLNDVIIEVEKTDDKKLIEERGESFVKQSSNIASKYADLLNIPSHQNR